MWKVCIIYLKLELILDVHYFVLQLLNEAVKKAKLVFIKSKKHIWEHSVGGFWNIPVA